MLQWWSAETKKIWFYFRRMHIPEIKHRNKTLKQPETVLAFTHDETEIKQNCRRSAETKQLTVGSFVYFSLFHDVGCASSVLTHQLRTEQW